MVYLLLLTLEYKVLKLEAKLEPITLYVSDFLKDLRMGLIFERVLYYFLRPLGASYIQEGLIFESVL